METYFCHDGISENCTVIMGERDAGKQRACIFCRDERKRIAEKNQHARDHLRKNFDRDIELLDY